MTQKTFFSASLVKLIDCAKKKTFFVPNWTLNRSMPFDLLCNKN